MTHGDDRTRLCRSYAYLTGRFTLTVTVRPATPVAATVMRTARRLPRSAVVT